MDRPLISALCRVVLLLLLATPVRAGAPLSDELLAPAAPRPAPRARPEIAPQPLVFTSRSVLYAARSGDGRYLATVEQGEGGQELWLYPRAVQQELPRLLLTSPVRLAAPALNRDASQLVFVDCRDDLKGDIWLLDLTAPGATARRLTGKEGEDDAPVFTLDGREVIYHRQVPGSTEREAIRLNPATGRSVPFGIPRDAAFLAPAPDGRRWVFVSRRADSGEDLWLRETDGALRQLTRAPGHDLYPAWSGEETLLFTRLSGRAAPATVAQLYRLDLQRRGDDNFPRAFALTATSTTALAPLSEPDRLLFVAGLGSGGQLVSLPAAGEIPVHGDLAAQWEVAQRLLERQPPDRPHARLACERVLAREEAPSREGALAMLALAELLEADGEGAAAEELYLAAARRYGAFPREAALAAISALRLEAVRRCAEVVLAPRRQGVIQAAEAAMQTAASGAGSDAQARGLIDAARLYNEQGSGAADRLEALKRLERVKELAAVSRPLLAEAVFRRAELIAGIESGESGEASLVGVMSDFGDQERWSEAARAALLDRSGSQGGDAVAASRRLSALAERYRTGVPRLAMGAWNRIGDLAYRDGEWARAKDAYRIVLEQFPPLPTPTAAARFALAEILYREERYAEATALYENEMAAQAEDDPLYQLARAAYIRKTLAAGESLYRSGELAAARATFLAVIRYDGRSIEAHRGYIKSVAAQGQAEELLGLYRRLLRQYPDDPLLLYATGLCTTYLPGKENLTEAERLLTQAGERLPASEYPPQTLGYLAEVRETLYGERGGLERALQLYRRAALLNRARENPENRANLELNLGNAAFLLGRNATAWEHYQRRLMAGILFDHPDTELLFHQRYAAVAFQMGEKSEPIAGYERALALVDARLDPARPLLLFGRLTRRVNERLFSTETVTPPPATLREHQAIAVELDRLGATPVAPPPADAWESLAAALRKLLGRERSVIDGAAGWNREGWRVHGGELQGMAQAVARSLDEVLRLVETRAELQDRLGLACLEAERYAAAREHFAAAFTLNRGLGKNGNLVANRRSASVAAFAEAEENAGEARTRLLRTARDGFREVLLLLPQYPPAAKPRGGEGEGLVKVGSDVALDESAATAAAFGFSAIQEERLAKTYLARIAAALGEPEDAAALLQEQLAAYPADSRRIARRDLFGVALLNHRYAHAAYALERPAEAAAAFRASTLLNLQEGNPVSAMINLVNWGELLTGGSEAETADFLALTAAVSALAADHRGSLPPEVLPRFHNEVAVLFTRRAAAQDDPAARTALLVAALSHLQQGLAAIASGGGATRTELSLRAALQLNRGGVLTLLGFADEAAAVWGMALETAQQAWAPQYEWRALAGLGRYVEAVKLLAELPPGSWDLQLGEVRERFAPYLEPLAQQDAEGAFALLEQLSEIERVQLLGRGTLAMADATVAATLRQLQPHLVKAEQLRAQLVAAKQEERDYLQLRLQQENALIAEVSGSRRERLPEAYGGTSLSVLNYAASAAAFEETADLTVSGGNGAVYRDELAKVAAARKTLRQECAATGNFFCRLLTSQPVEAIDLLEGGISLPVWRLTPVAADRWLLFTLGGRAGIAAETLDEAALTDRLAQQKEGIAVYEEPWRFSRAPVANWGVSGSQLLRAIRARQPFRRQVLDPSGWWPAGPPFVKLEGGVGERLADAHTLVFPKRGGLLALPSTAPGEGDRLLPQWEGGDGERRSFAALQAAGGLALVVAPRAGLKQAYALGQFLPLVGVASVLIGEGGGEGAAEFVAAYATQPLAAARARLGSGWLLVGDGGLDAQSAAQLGKRQFLAYGKEGVTAHNAGRYSQALAAFDNALAIAEQNPELAKHRTALHRYARESAYAAGDTALALAHAEALAKGLKEEKPYSAEQADALLRLGLLQGRAERYPEAAASLKESVALFAELGLDAQRAAALGDFGVVMENAVDYPAALSLFEEAAGLRRTLRDELSLADQYRNLGRLYDLRLNQYAVAGRYYGQAGELYAKAGKPSETAETLLDQGRCRRLLGDFAGAETLYQQALVLAGAAPSRTRMRIVLEQANNAWFQGRYQEAFDLRGTVETAAKQEGWPLEQVMVRNTGGLIWWTLGDLPRAQLELRRALEQARQLEVRRDEVATSLNNLGLVQRDAGDFLSALQSLGEALTIDRQLGSRWAMAYDLRNLGQTRLRMGDPGAALPLLDEAAALAAAIGDQVNLAKTRLARGDAAAALGQTDQAAADYRQALSVADALLLREVRWRALFGLARLQRQRGEAAAAVAAYREALATIEELRAEIRLDQLKDGFLADKMDVYAGLVELLVDQQRPDEAFAVAERSRARNLIDLLGRQRLSLAGSVDQELYDRQLRLKAQLQEQEQLAAQAPSEAERARYAAALETLRADYRDLLLEIERQRPELLALVKVVPLELSAIQAQLDPGVVLLSYYQLPQRLLCWRIEREKSAFFSLPVPAAPLTKAIGEYRRMLQNLEPLAERSRSLYDQLLAPVLQGLGPVRALGVIPHGSLHYLAFATLSDGRDYLVDRQSLFYLPAASVLRYTLARRPLEKNRRVLAIGNPDLGDPALDLPFAEREAGTLRWNYPEVTLLTRERATESWVRKEIGRYGIIHLASHGEFDPVNPLFSAVRLSRDAAADGRLEAEEIFGLDLKADLVVLSACQTGLGDVRRGDDVVGMNRAFLYAGTHALMSSLWRVSDVSTAILMKQFYRAYTRDNKADSLRRAMLQVKNRYPHPGYWGAFVLSGDFE